MLVELEDLRFPILGRPLVEDRVDPSIPMSLSDAMATEPVWLRAWIQVLIGVHFAALLFIVGREGGRWRFRAEPAALLAAFIAAALVMGRLYDSVGYVRLLGLAHLLCWGPVWIWILLRRKEFEIRSIYGGYIHVYLLIAGISLVIDALDVGRYVLGDGELLGRWSDAG